MKNRTNTHNYHQFHNIGVSERDIHDIVHQFYAEVRKDPEIGPIFDSVINNNWDEHLSKMCDFWSSVIHKSGRYNGNPLVKHMQLKALRPNHFEIWLKCFRATVCKVLEKEAADVFIEKAERIATAIKSNIFTDSRNIQLRNINTEQLK